MLGFYKGNSFYWPHLFLEWLIFDIMAFLSNEPVKQLWKDIGHVVSYNMDILEAVIKTKP